MDGIDRPGMPAGYGRPASDDGLLPWSWVEERLVAARNYWLCTTRADGRPHAMPVWGVWHDARLWFSTDPESLKGRNIAARPDIVVHLESGDETVAVEGRATTLDVARMPDFVAAYEAKYATRPDPSNPAHGCYELVPERVLAWTEADFANSRTRFRRTLRP